jgi:hypothetical protein
MVFIQTIKYTVLAFCFPPAEAFLALEVRHPGNTVCAVARQEIRRQPRLQTLHFVLVCIVDGDDLHRQCLPQHLLQAVLPIHPLLESLDGKSIRIPREQAENLCDFIHV